MDTSFPDLNGKSEKEQVQTLVSYLYALLENLRYVLGNLGEENINETEWKKITNQVVFTALGQEGATIINGGNITTGTIDASKATIENIDARKITVGELNGVNIRGVKIYGVDVYGSIYHDAESGSMFMDLRHTTDGARFIIGDGDLGNVMFDVLCDVTEQGGYPLLRTALRLNGMTAIENTDSPIYGTSGFTAGGEWTFDHDITLPAGSAYPTRSEVQSMIDAALANYYTKSEADARFEPIST